MPGDHSGVDVARGPSVDASAESSIGPKPTIQIRPAMLEVIASQGVTLQMARSSADFKTLMREGRERCTGLGDHLLFVGADDADGDAAGVSGDYSCQLCVTRFIQFDAEKAQSRADARADRG